MKEKSIDFKKGDIVKSRLRGVPKKHICIILEDEPVNGHIKCISVCNLTSAPVPLGEYGIDISHYNLPEEWFDEKKPTTWLRCNEVDCIYSCEIEDSPILGNIVVEFPKLWTEVCSLVHNCPISYRLKSVCECDFEILDKQIELGLTEPNDCGCQ